MKPNYTLRRFIVAVLTIPLALALWSLGYIALDILADSQGATWGNLIGTYPPMACLWVALVTILPNLK